MSVFDPPLTDVSGFATRDTSETIQLVDLDGDGDDEMIVRVACGLRSYDFLGGTPPPPPPSMLTASLIKLRDAGVPFVAFADLAPWEDHPSIRPRPVEPAVNTLTRNGWTGRITIRMTDMSVVGGHRLVAAAVALGLTEVPVIRLENAGADARLYGGRP